MEDGVNRNPPDNLYSYEEIEMLKKLNFKWSPLAQAWTNRKQRKVHLKVLREEDDEGLFLFIYTWNQAQRRWEEFYEYCPDVSHLEKFLFESFRLVS